MFESILLIFPEMILAVTGLALMLSELTFFKENRRWIDGIYILGMMSAFCSGLYLANISPYYLVMQDELMIDNISVFIKLFFILNAFVSFIIYRFIEFSNHRFRFEFYLFSLALTTSSCFFVSSNHFLPFFIFLIFMVLFSVFLITLNREERIALETGFKFFLLSSLSLVLIIFSFGLMFHVMDSFYFHELFSQAVSQPEFFSQHYLILLILGMGCSFFLAVFPFHYWPADLMTVSSFAAGFLIHFVFPIGFFTFLLKLRHAFSSTALWDNVGFSQLVSLSIILTLLISVFLAFSQRRLKRLLGWLLLGRGAFFLLVLLPGQTDLSTHLLFSLFGEVLCWSGVFLCGAYLSSLKNHDRVHQWFNLIKTNPVPSLGFLCFLALAMGLPPSPLFLSRVLILEELFTHNYYVLGMTIFIYLFGALFLVGKLGFEFFQNQDNKDIVETPSDPKSFHLGMLGLLMPIIWLFVYPAPFLKWSSYAIERLFW